jgi:hypothetical protein
MRASGATALVHLSEERCDEESAVCQHQEKADFSLRSK